MKARRPLSRRSFLARVAGGGALSGALAMVGGEAAGAMQVTDSDSGPKGDPAGRGRGRTGESDGDPTDPAGRGRPRTGISDSDSGRGADAAGRGRGHGQCSDRDRGQTGDPPGRGRRCTRR